MQEPARETLKIIVTKPRPGVGHLRIVGSVDASNVTRLRTAIDNCFHEGVYRLVMNLQEADYIASSGFSCFLMTLDTARGNGGHLIFVLTPPGIRRIFDIFGLSAVLHFTDDLDKALDYLAS